MILPPPKSKVSLPVHILFLGRCGNPVLHDSSIQAAKNDRGRLRNVHASCCRPRERLLEDTGADEAYF
jgi:hypothetical protein